MPVFVKKMVKNFFLRIKSVTFAKFVREVFLKTNNIPFYG